MEWANKHGRSLITRCTSDTRRVVRVVFSACGLIVPSSVCAAAPSAAASLLDQRIVSALSSLSSEFFL